MKPITKLRFLQDLDARIGKLSAGETDQTARLELEWLTAQREALAAEVPAPYLHAYDRLYAQTGGTPVADVKGEYCMACRLGLPTRLLAGLKANAQLRHCDRCGRILHWAG